MGTTEIILIVIGLIFIIGSFFLKEVLSQKDIEQIAKLSEIELKTIIDRKMKDANEEITASIDDAIEEASDKTKREMEKETNEKIMAISEFSDTVLDSMNKTHNEIMFLYSMLNDKHGELTSLAGDLSHFSAQMKETENEILTHLSEAANEMENKVNNIESETMMQSESPTEEAEDDTRSNDRILELHRQGKTDVEIAKTLGRGLGEVKLVLGLYQEVENREA